MIVRIATLFLRRPWLLAVLIIVAVVLMSPGVR